MCDLKVAFLLGFDNIMIRPFIARFLSRHRPFTAVTRVRIPSRTPIKSICNLGSGRAFADVRQKYGKAAVENGVDSVRGMAVGRPVVPAEMRSSP
jgi:hypothetical protein